MRPWRRWWKVTAAVVVAVLAAVVLVSRPGPGVDDPLAVQTRNRPGGAEPLPVDPPPTTTTTGSASSTTATSGPARSTTSTSRATPSTKPPRPTTTTAPTPTTVPPVSLIDPPTTVPPMYPTTTTTLDPKAPRPVAMTVTPREVDSSAGPATLTVRIEMSAPLGDIDPERFSVRFANGEQLRDVGGNAWDTGWARVSGDAYRGMYQSVLTLYQHSAHGPWKPEFISLVDTSGRYINHDDLPAERFEGFTQTGPGDSDPPTVTGLSFTRIPDQDSNGQTQILIKAQLSDPIAGISRAPESGRWGTSIEFFSPSGKLVLVGFGHQKPGPPERMDFEAILNLGSNPEPGVWKLRWVQVADLVGNQRYVPPAETAAAGPPTSFTIS